MKTHQISRKNFIQFIIFVNMLILFSAVGQDIQAQAGNSGCNLDSFLASVSPEDTLLSLIPSHLKNEEKMQGSEKWTIGNALRMFMSLCRQPFLSRKSQRSGPYDVIIIPGFPYQEDKGAGLILKVRIQWAHYLISEGITRHVIFSGSAVYTPYVESRIMALYAEQIGIPYDHILCEVKAEHSTENVVYSIRMAQEMGFERIAIATGPYQSAFLSEYVKEHSLPVSFIPIPASLMAKAKPVRFSEIDPSTAFVENFVSLTERETRSERQQGSLGNRIDE